MDKCDHGKPLELFNRVPAVEGYKIKAHPRLISLTIPAIAFSSAD